MLPGVTAFPCHHLCAERWRMSGSSVWAPLVTPGIRWGTSKSLCGSRRGRIERVASRVFTAVIRASQAVPLCLAGSYQRTWLTVFSPCGKSFSHEGKPVSQCEMGFQTTREILACFGKFDTIIFQWREGRLLSVCSSLLEIYYQIGGRYSFTYYNLKSLPCLLS